MKLPLPGDIRFVFEDEEFEYKRGRVQLAYGCVHFVCITEEGICSGVVLAPSSKQVFMFLTSSNGLCDHHYISAIFCLCDCQFGGLCDLCLHQYVHIDGIRDPVAITR